MRGRFRIPFLRHPAKCAEVRELMSDYVDEEAGAAERRRVERHLRFCRPCGRVLANLRGTLERLGRLSDASPVAEAEEDEVAERIRARWRDGAP